VSYRELDEWSTRVARVLIEAGVGPQGAVGVAMDRCVELVVAWWAVVKAGGVYVPVDVAYPVERVAAVLDAVDAVCVLSCGVDRVAGAGGRRVIRLDGLDLSGGCAEPITDAERLGPLSVEDTAYVIFTSGSTGIPKGVAVGHAGLLGVAAAQRALFGVGAGGRVLMVAAPTFDLSIFEWLWAAGSGAALVVTPPGVYAGEPLSCLLRDQRVSAAILTPTVLASLDRSRLSALQTLIAGAEPCPPELVAAWAPGRRMFNAYGPTEATIWATCTTALSAGQPVTIGTPIPGVCALVLDARLQPAPIGVVGELYLAGPALAHGYVGQPQLTAQRFVPNPYGAPGTRMYRTGDLVRWTPQGTLQCLGRADSQIKLRGQRIELGEIENALLACPHVTQAAATVHHTTTGTDHLVGYISGSPALDPTAIRQQLSNRLPASLVPAQVVVLEDFPRTASGKLDRNALPPPEFAAAQYRPPHTPTEKIVAETFAEVLGLDRVGLDDDFFALGGDSLLATRVSTRLQLALDTDVPVRSLFDTPTVADLANHLHRRTGAIAVQEILPIQNLKKGTGVPLYCIHPGGGVSWPYQALGKYLDCPIIGIQQTLQFDETEPRSIHDMAKNYADRIQTVYPTGPVNLLGWSFGGIIAHELAIELRGRGRAIAHLVLLDADPVIDDTQELGDWRTQLEALRFYGVAIPEQDEPLAYEQIEALIRDSDVATEFPRYKQLLDLFTQNITRGTALYRAHHPDVFDGDMVIFSAVRGEGDRSLSLRRSWRPYVAGDITVHSVDCMHQEMLTTESLRMYGRQLAHSLTRVASGDVSVLVCDPDQVGARTTPQGKWSPAGQAICTVGTHVHEDQRRRVAQSSSGYPGCAL
ncbi:amino acid adenylation domain-containing protein, partial [Mycobacterium kiyosense]